MKVKLITPLASATGAFNVGDEYDCASAAEAQRMIEAGMAVAIVAEKVERAVKKSPAKEKRG